MNDEKIDSFVGYAGYNLLINFVFLYCDLCSHEIDMIMSVKILC